MLGYGMLTLLGVALIAFGFWGGYRCRTPYDHLAAWCAPLGLLVVFVSVVLLFIPHFFA